MINIDSKCVNFNFLARIVKVISTQKIEKNWH